MTDLSSIDIQNVDTKQLNQLFDFYSNYSNFKGHKTNYALVYTNDIELLNDSSVVKVLYNHNHNIYVYMNEQWQTKLVEYIKNNSSKIYRISKTMCTYGTLLYRYTDNVCQVLLVKKRWTSAFSTIIHAVQEYKLMNKSEFTSNYNKCTVAEQQILNTMTIDFFDTQNTTQLLIPAEWLKSDIHIHTDYYKLHYNEIHALIIAAKISHRISTTTSHADDTVWTLCKGQRDINDCIHESLHQTTCGIAGVGHYTALRELNEEAEISLDEVQFNLACKLQFNTYYCITTDNDISNKVIDINCETIERYWCSIDDIKTMNVHSNSRDIIIPAYNKNYLRKPKSKQKSRW